MSGPMRVITLGVHVLDVLVRPVEVIPEGQAASSSTASASPRPAWL